MKNITYSEFMDTVKKTYLVTNGKWRLGQVYFNILEYYKKDIADEIRGTDVDPYYSEIISQKLKEVVMSKWNNSTKESV